MRLVPLAIAACCLVGCQDVLTPFNDPDSSSYAVSRQQSTAPTTTGTTTTSPTTPTASAEGIIVFEAESSPAGSGWELRSEIADYTGSGYYQWTGSDNFNNPGQGVIRYSFTVPEAGNYELRWRSYIAVGDSGSEHNDSFVRFPTGENVDGEWALDGWTKVYMNQRERWSWKASTKDNDPRPIRQFFSAGTHTLELSGRSHGHAIDRIALYTYETVDFDEQAFTTAGSPPSGDG